MRTFRKTDEIRKITVHKNFMKNAAGSVLIEAGKTRVLCTAMLEPGVPPFLEDTQKGWLTAEYAMLPASTRQRKKRETLKADGRSIEIRRLIGRSLRSITDLTWLLKNTVYIDCDVIEADGGTRTTAITGAFIALVLAVDKLILNGVIQKSPIRDYVAAVSCGIVGDEPMLDLCYAEDSNAQADMNVVMSKSGGLIEVQCTAEKRPVTDEEFQTLYSMAKNGIQDIIAIQKKALGSCAGRIGDGHV